VICSPETGEVLGLTRYLDLQVAHAGLEIGHTWLAPAHWRTAVNTAAKRLLLAHAFETLGAERVCLKTDILNERSQRAIERLGAQREGVLRAHRRRRDGSLRDTVYYSLLASEWPQARDRLDRALERVAGSV
jgi:RimJ/RimL family protein N-acetyltransferase